MLHCKHQNERLEFGMESVSTLAHTFINKEGTIVPCRTAMVDLGVNEIDPGLAPDGAKCGDNMVSISTFLPGDSNFFFFFFVNHLDVCEPKMHVCWGVARNERHHLPRRLQRKRGVQ